MEKINQLKTLIESIEGDSIKFYEKDNSAAGTRIRKVLQEIKKLSQEIRLEISEKKKSN